MERPPSDVLFCYYNTSWPAAKGPCGPRTVFSLFPLPVCHSKPAFLRAPAIQQKPPFVPRSTKSGFVTSYFRRKEPYGSLFRQVLFVLQAVLDVLDRCALKPYEPLLIVWAQYTTFWNLSQHRFYFEYTLSTFVTIAIVNHSFSHRKDDLSSSAKKTSFSQFHLLDVSPSSVLLSLYLAAFLPQFCSPSTTFSHRFCLQYLYIFFIISPDHLSDTSQFIIVISSFLLYFGIAYFVGDSPIVYITKSSYLRHLHKITPTTKPLPVNEVHSVK